MTASVLRSSSRADPGAASLPSPLASCHGHVWRANQMGVYSSAVIATGYGALDAELPNGGWPTAALTELLQQPGTGEMRLLQPALQRIAKNRSVALVQPPHLPQAIAWSAWGLPTEQLLWVKTARSADALWAAEQILRNGSCGALLLWQSHIRHESLRRLHLAAQASDMLFWMLRPLSAMQDASPAPLRISLRAANGGVDIDIVKRRGPHHERSLFLPLNHLPASRSTQTEAHHALVDRRAPAVAAARNVPAALV
jgi:protein ImuA